MNKSGSRYNLRNSIKSSKLIDLLSYFKRVFVRNQRWKGILCPHTPRAEVKINHLILPQKQSASDSQSSIAIQLAKVKLVRMHKISLVYLRPQVDQNLDQ